jgi:tRNA-specific 2-thiouridylase
VARVFAALSGGVDSSVAAALLMEGGHDVTGVTLSLLPMGAGGISSARQEALVRNARQVCDTLAIPHVVVDARKEFTRGVIEPYAAAYASGLTPNPCIECNSRIKFGLLMDEALSRGADLFATGHYARIVAGGHGEARVARSVDARKDQSYALYRVAPGQMSRIVFPLGGLSKGDVRAMAAELGMHVHDAEESQEACFAPLGHSQIVGQQRPQALLPGPIVDLRGRELGKHRGLARYTVGQRHGLALSGPEGPYYVIALDAAHNAIVVGGRDALRVTHIEASSVVWHRSGSQAEVVAQTRYRAEPVAASARIEDDTLLLDLSSPLFGVAPGQAVVCYEEDRIVGGGVIERTS